MIKQPEGTNKYMPSCGVIACAVVTGQSFSECFKEFRELMNYSKNWRGRTVPSARNHYLTHKGYSLVNEPFEPGTLKKWVENESRKNIKYIVTLGSHVVCVENGIVVDQHSADEINKHGSKQKRLKMVQSVKLTLDHRNNHR